MKKFDLSGKTAIVTGGGSGIGEAIVKTLAASGAYVILLDISLEDGERVKKETDGVVEVFQVDVSKPKAMKDVIEKSLEGRRLDIMVNNAGIAHIGNVSNTSEKDLDKLYEVNVKGVFNGMQIAVEHMKKYGGSIINMSSIAAHVGVSDRFAYSMTKGAVHAMTLSVAKDYLDHNIRCNTISPGRVHTPFVDGFLKENYPGNEKEMFDVLSKTQPIGRMGKPEEISALVLYLASDEASFITGTDFPIDGGFIKLNS